MTKKEWIENLIIAGCLVLFLSLTGCARWMTSRTEVHFNVVTKDGTTCSGEYVSDKEQQGLEAQLCGGTMKVDRSGTLEQVVAKTAELQATLGRIIEQLMPLAAKAAAS